MKINQLGFVATSHHTEMSLGYIISQYLQRLGGGQMIGLEEK